MNFKRVSIGFFLATCMSAMAGTISFDTLVDADGNDYLLRTSAGVNMSSGQVRVGIFSTISDVLVGSSSFSALASDFVELGFDDFSDIDSPFTSPMAGMAKINSDYGNPNTYAPPGILGRTIYVFVGNNTSVFGNSTQFALIRSNQIVDADGTPPGDANTISLASSTIVYGTSGTNGGTLPAPTYNATSVGGGANQSANAINLIPVPEPSVALLGGLGVLGLVARRRRN